MEAGHDVANPTDSLSPSRNSAQCLMRRASPLARTVLKSGELWFEAYRRPDGFVLHWPRAAMIHLSSDGRRIHLAPTPGATPISVAVLHHIGEAYRDSLRGLESLHATVLYRKRSVIGLMAPPGEGKTTLADYLISRGWRCLGDDIFLPEFRNDSVWPARRESFLKTTSRGARSNGLPYDANLEKYVRSIPPRNAPGPIRALIRLYRMPRGPVRLHRLSPGRAAPHLMANVYNDLLRTPRTRRRQFEWAIQIASRVPVWTLRYPTGTRHLHRVHTGLTRILVESGR